ncbi:MAG: hypothetical protein WBB28_18195 [Crinalium sp.]
MSENIRNPLQQLTNEELLDFALEQLGQEHESVRQSALQEHFIRVKNAESTLIAPPGDVQYLRSKLSQIAQHNT